MTVERSATSITTPTCTYKSWELEASIMQVQITLNRELNHLNTVLHPSTRTDL
jgi:hypothetical protein